MQGTVPRGVERVLLTVSRMRLNHLNSERYLIRSLNRFAIGHMYPIEVHGNACLGVPAGRCGRGQLPANPKFLPCDDDGQDSRPWSRLVRNVRLISWLPALPSSLVRPSFAASQPVYQFLQDNARCHPISTYWLAASLVYVYLQVKLNAFMHVAKPLPLLREARSVRRLHRRAA